MRPFSLGLGNGKFLRRAGRPCPAIACERAVGAIRLFGATDGGAKVHHGLSIVAWPARRGHGFGQSADLTANLIQRALDSMIARDHSGDICIDHRGSLAERNRGDRSGRIFAQSGQGSQFRFGSGKAAAPDNFSGARNQVAGSGVIAKARPFGEDLFIVRSSERFDGRPALDETPKPRLHGGDRSLLKHHLAKPDGIGLRWSDPRRAPPWQVPRIGVIVCEKPGRGMSFVDELLCSTGGHEIAMAWSIQMAKPLRPESKVEAPRRGHARACGDLVGDIAGTSFKRFGFVQGAVVSRWPEIVGDRYAKVSTPESIRFPAGKKSGGTLTLNVEGAHAPLMQHLGPLIIERVNRFFGYEAISKLAFRQGRVSNAKPALKRPVAVDVPKELGEGLREIADPELRACLESLAAKLAGSRGVPDVDNLSTTTIPIIRSK